MECQKEKKSFTPISHSTHTHKVTLLFGHCVCFESMHTQWGAGPVECPSYTHPLALLSWLSSVGVISKQARSSSLSVTTCPGRCCRRSSRCAKELCLEEPGALLLTKQNIPYHTLPYHQCAATQLCGKTRQNMCIFATTSRTFAQPLNP